MRKPVFLAVTGIVSLGSLGLAACGSNTPATSGSPQAGTPITIGVSVSLTGDFSGDGKALVQGYDLWAADENAKGGLLGHHVTMKYVDDASSTTQVVTNYQNLITQDKVALVFGPFSSLLRSRTTAGASRNGCSGARRASGRRRPRTPPRTIPSRSPRSTRLAPCSRPAASEPSPTRCIRPRPRTSPRWRSR